MDYKEIAKEDIGRIIEIDRSEEIFEYYRYNNGALTLCQRQETVHHFEPSELNDIITRQIKLKGAGGKIIGAFDGEKLIGVVSVDPIIVGTKFKYCKMDILYVSKAYRRRGIGNQLVNESKKAARGFGAEKLYISATPTKNTIEFYLNAGARLTEELDKELYEREPDDIHLELIL